MAGNRGQSKISSGKAKVNWIQQTTTVEHNRSKPGTYWKGQRGSEKKERPKVNKESKWKQNYGEG
jgi:hypothetical protein